LDAGFWPGLLYVYIGDVTETRARMPLILSSRAALGSDGFSVNTRTFTVPKGKFVTLFAAEQGPLPTNNARQFPSLFSKVVETVATEFAGWSGATLGQPEPGVATIKMDADAAVTAEFRKTEGFTYAKIGCEDISVSSSGPGNLGYGTVVPHVSPFSNNWPGLSPLSSESEDYFFYGKQGTVFTLRALKREVRAAISETGFINWSGAGSSCGSSLTCSVTVPAFGASAASVLRANFSFPTIAGFNGCGGCNPATGCAIRP